MERIETLEEAAMAVLMETDIMHADETESDALDFPEKIAIVDADGIPHLCRRWDGSIVKITKDLKFPVKVHLLPPDELFLSGGLRPQYCCQCNDFDDLKDFIEHDLEDELKIFNKWCEENQKI